MEQGTPQDFERLHGEVDGILNGASRFDELIAGHPNTASGLTAASKQIVAEHEAAKAPEATGREPRKLWKAAKVVGSGAIWICVSFGQTMRPPEPIDYRDYDRSNPDL
jgi:hypothetical protein